MSDVFNNVIRAAMVEKRKIRFWSSMLRRIRYPQIQAPLKLPPLQMPKIEIPEITLHRDLCNLIYDNSEGDVVFVVRGHQFSAHKICLAVSAQVFENLFIETEVIWTDTVPAVIHRSLSSQNQMITNKNTNSSPPMDNSIRRSHSTNDRPDHTNDFSIPIHSAFLTVEEESVDNPFKPGELTVHTVVTVRNEVTPRAFQIILEYLYSGTVTKCSDCYEEVLIACRLLQLTNLAVMISNLANNEEYLNSEVEKEFLEYRKKKLRDLALNKEKLTGNLLDLLYEKLAMIFILTFFHN